MKKSFRSTVIMLCAMVLCLMVCTSGALAAQKTVSIDVEIKLEGTPLPSPAETYTVLMRADDASFPMPSGSSTGYYELKITGAGTAKFPVTTYDKVGVYTYTIQQVVGANAQCTYDQRIYDLTVTITNKLPNYDGFDAYVAFNEKSATEKPDKAEFINKYPIVTPTPTTPPSSGDGTITATGVTDSWPYYLAGAAVLVIIAFVMIMIMRRKEDETDGEKN
ncbi:MAG: hypothetical protein GX096_05410 [Clostridiales bacterium]|nr:hypothetical protein [Clostridiales bacterium]